MERKYTVDELLRGLKQAEKLNDYRSAAEIKDKLSAIGYKAPEQALHEKEGLIAQLSAENARLKLCIEKLEAEKQATQTLIEAENIEPETSSEAEDGENSEDMSLPNEYKDLTPGFNLVHSTLQEKWDYMDANHPDVKYKKTWGQERFVTEVVVALREKLKSE